ncbi:MAG: 5'-deoxyadenosine deaminase [Chloroflexi bacterium]|nr:5'-deoxyadenosine deaminase [Chloroflexota bacterium]
MPAPPTAAANAQPHAALALRGAHVVTMDPLRTLIDADVLVGADGRVAALAEPASNVSADQSIDVSGHVVVPGLVQAHIHLCQTLFRGLAEEQTLLEWLRERIWPLEAAHDPASLHASASLGIADLLLGGTTAILDMGTVHHTDAVFEAAAESGIRYTGGKALMDAGDGVPSGLLEPTAQALRDNDRLADRWHGSHDGRLRYAYSPRFVLTATHDLLRSIGARARANSLLVHTHASEQREETDIVRQRFGVTNIRLLANLGLADINACFAHCVWPEPEEFDVLASGGATVVHCPSCNMKLGSGVAPIAEYLDRGVNVALGADGAASNNRLDAFEEIRLAGLLSRFRDGPPGVSAQQLFEMATIAGARALGLDADIGSIEVGKYADLCVLDLQRAHVVGPEDVYTQLVYSARASDVRHVLVGGRILVQDGRLLAFSESDAVAAAAKQREALLKRAGIT